MAYNPKDKNPSGVVLFGNNGSDQVFESVTDFVYDTGNTRLGINTSSPQYTLDVSGTGTFHTIRFADGTEMITSGGGGGGGMTSWDLSVTGDSTTISDGETVTFTGQGSITTTRNANTVIISGAAGGGGMTSWTIADGSGNSEAIGNADTLYISGAGSVVTDYDTATNIMTVSGTAGGGGGTPGGSVNQIQINDGAGGFTTATDSDRLAYIPSTNTLNLGRAIATDLYSGTQVTNFWYGDNFAIGGNNFLSLGSTSDRNTAIGYGAAQSLTVGNDDNVIIGYDALNLSTINCDLSVFIGSQIGSNGGGYNACVGIGSNILSTFSSTSALLGTIGIGYNVFNALTNSPNYDIGIGYNVLNIYNETSTVGGNIAIGYQAMYNISNGQYNVAIGYNALTNAGTRGGIDNNVIIGQGAAQGATTNFANNVAIGSEALGSTNNNLSTENVIIGRLAAQSCTNIDDSIVIGNNALSTLNLATAGNIILNNRDIYGAGGLVASDANRLLIGDTLGGNLLTKRIKIGGSNVVDVDTAVLEVECNSSTDAGLLVQGAAAQSANLQEWRNSSDTELASVGPAGRLYYQSSYSPISDEGTASSFTFDLDTSNVFSGTLNGVTTLATSNGDVGQRFLVRLKQDGTGGRTVGTWFGGRVSWPGGSAPTLSSSANLVDLFGFLVTSGTAPTLYYDGFTIATGIQ